MALYGDIPVEDRELEKELLEMEAYFNTHLDVYPPEMIARVFVCLSHDYYEISDDQKGSELLEKADKICPGYFDNQIKDHIEEDPDFAYLVENLTRNILVLARSIMDKQMKVQFTCRYCNHKWREDIYTSSVSNKKCEKCRDTNLDMVELDKYRIDGYVGCPPFEEKKKSIENDWNF